ncbi:MAG: peptidylprolyl isomerase [Chrysiogenales bacterium]|nr:MAG: peptidylprolyl isomerase [Chrysiogenales bacterium]
MLTVLSALLLSMPAAGEKVTCRIETAAGDIIIEVYPEKAPLSAANFLRYVDSGLYNGSTFFRVLTADNQPDSEFKIEVIQGGDVAEEKCFPPIAHETTKMTGFRHLDGVVSMARAAPGTASCSFFICVNVQPELDHGGRRNPDGQGFAAFGRVVTGMDVIKKIQYMEVSGQYLKKPVTILSIRRQEP